MLNENMYAVAVAIGEVIVKNFPIGVPSAYEEFVSIRNRFKNFA